MTETTIQLKKAFTRRVVDAICLAFVIGALVAAPVSLALSLKAIDVAGVTLLAGVACVVFTLALIGYACHRGRV